MGWRKGTKEQRKRRRMGKGKGGDGKGSNEPPSQNPGSVAVSGGQRARASPSLHRAISELDWLSVSYYTIHIFTIGSKTF